MKRIVSMMATLVIALGAGLVVAPPAAAESPRGQLGCSGCSMRYGVKQSWYTACWTAGSRPPRLEAKVDGRWKVYDRQAVPLTNLVKYGEVVCENPKFPVAMKYTFTVTDEGTLLDSGGYAGTGLLPMREVYTSNGKTKYNYYSTHVSFG